MGVSSLPKTVTRQRRDCDLNPGLSAPDSGTLTTRLPSHPFLRTYLYIIFLRFISDKVVLEERPKTLRRVGRFEL